MLFSKKSLQKANIYRVTATIIDATLRQTPQNQENFNIIL